MTPKRTFDLSLIDRLQTGNHRIQRGQGIVRAVCFTKVDGLCAERDRQRKEQFGKYPGTNKAINGPIERRFR